MKRCDSDRDLERCVLCGWRLNDTEAGHEGAELRPRDPFGTNRRLCRACADIRYAEEG